MNKIIKDYIKYVLSKVMYKILMKNNAYLSNMGDGDIENLFNKIYDEMDKFPNDYFTNVFKPVLKDE